MGSSSWSNYWTVEFSTIRATTFIVVIIMLGDCLLAWGWVEEKANEQTCLEHLLFSNPQIMEQ